MSNSQSTKSMIRRKRQARVSTLITKQTALGQENFLRVLDRPSTSTIEMMKRGMKARARRRVLDLKNLLRYDEGI